MVHQRVEYCHFSVFFLHFFYFHDKNHMNQHTQITMDCTNGKNTMPCNAQCLVLKQIL